MPRTLVTTRRSQLLILVGLALAVLAAIFAHGAKSQKTAPPAPFVVQGDVASSGAAGVTIPIAKPWAVIPGEPQPGADFVLEHPGGARFIASSTAPEKGSKVDPTLQLMIDNKRKQYGAVEDVAWGDDTVAGLHARTLAFTVQGPARRARSKLWLVERGPYWIVLTCGGAESTFLLTEQLCRSVLGTVRVEPAK